MIGVLVLALTWCPAPLMGESWRVSCRHCGSVGVAMQSEKGVRLIRLLLTISIVKHGDTSLIVCLLIDLVGLENVGDWLDDIADGVLDASRHRDILEDRLSTDLAD